MLHIYIYIDKWMCQNGLINPLCQTIPPNKIDQIWMETCQQWIWIVNIDTGKNLWGSWVLPSPHLHILQHPIAGFRWDPWPTLWHQVACRTSATVGPESDFTWPRMSCYVSYVQKESSNHKAGQPREDPWMPTEIQFFHVLPANASHDSHSRTGRCLVQGRVT